MSRSVSSGGSRKIPSASGIGWLNDCCGPTPLIVSASPDASEYTEMPSRVRRRTSMVSSSPRSHVVTVRLSAIVSRPDGSTVTVKERQRRCKLPRLTTAIETTMNAITIANLVGLSAAIATHTAATPTIASVATLMRSRRPVTDAVDHVQPASGCAGVAACCGAGVDDVSGSRSEAMEPVNPTGVTPTLTGLPAGRTWSPAVGRKW